MKEILFPVLGLLLGSGFGFLMPVEIPQTAAPYMAIAILACLDSLFGGFRSGLEGKFKFEVFVSGFFMNAVLAVILVFLGERLLGISLQVAVFVLYAMRLFKNFSDIRRHILQKNENRENQ